MSFTDYILLWLERFHASEPLIEYERRTRG